MNYLKIDNCSACNGIGFRIVFWVAGCTHSCKGCQNPESWDFDNGQLCNKEVIYNTLDLLEPSYIEGITLSGGDPLHPKNVFKHTNDIITVYDIVKEIRKRFGGSKTIWVYTGYRWEEIVNFASRSFEYDYVLNNINVLVDGEFKQDCRDITLPFRGSLNQNIIDVQESLSKKELVKWRHNDKDEVK